MGRKIYILLFLTLFSFRMDGQTASNTSGCAELKVQFTALIGSTFF